VHNNNAKKSKFYYVGKDGLRFYVIDDLIKKIDNVLYDLKNEKTIKKIIILFIKEHSFYYTF